MAELDTNNFMKQIIEMHTNITEENKKMKETVADLQAKLAKLQEEHEVAQKELEKEKEEKQQIASKLEVTMACEKEEKQKATAAAEEVSILREKMKSLYSCNHVLSMKLYKPDLVEEISRNSTGYTRQPILVADSDCKYFYIKFWDNYCIEENAYSTICVCIHPRLANLLMDFCKVVKSNISGSVNCFNGQFKLFTNDKHEPYFYCAVNGFPAPVYAKMQQPSTKEQTDKYIAIADLCEKLGYQRVEIVTKVSAEELKAFDSEKFQQLLKAQEKA